jgi:nicotinate-nucleotide adenylyltransferase
MSPLSPPSPETRLGLLGGTLDPIHFGHLDAAEAARISLSLDAVWFVPSHDPPHRPDDPVASAFHRFAMTALAIADRPYFSASDIELRRPGVSYTVDTLQELHAAGWTPSQIFFTIGADAFADIASWRAYPGVLDAANFVVIGRSGVIPSRVVAQTPGLENRVAPLDYLPAHSADTRVYPVAGNTRDVSSSLIRTRLRQGERIDDLVPVPVERHIMTHRLYSLAGPMHDSQ